MLTNSNKITIAILLFLCLLITLLLNYVLNKKKKKQLDKIFIIIFCLFIFWLTGLVLQIFCVNLFNANPIYFDYFVYIAICYMPISFFFMALIFAKTRINFHKKYMLLFIIPTLSLILLWTNNFHHLFYQTYSTDVSKTDFGNYYYIYFYYTMTLYMFSLLILMRYSIKNSGFFSKQATLILIGALVPLITNVLGTFGIISMSIYTTPITFSITIICLTLAIFKFNLFKITPIALQRIVDRISDSYIILNENYEITDFNETFLNTFHLNASTDLRGENLETFLQKFGKKTTIKKIMSQIDKNAKSNSTESFELYIKSINKYFNVEITSIRVNNQFLGILVLFKDISQHIEDMQNLKDNQSMLMEKERLASLGQMIGGIAHNLKTPIFSVAGGLEGLSDLVKEYDESIDDPNVTSKDMHDIAKDMNEWIIKLKEHVSYMSDVITTVKGQAVNMSEDQRILFPVSELFQHVNILMQHEMKEKLATLNIENNVPNDIKIDGNINSLVQVINNLISNAIEAYGDAIDKKVDLSAKTDSKNIIISVKDYGPGLPQIVQEKLFKEMITTKGKNGTGLGLFMSYSNIKAHFNGNITFNTAANLGTVFNIIIPMKK